MDDWLEWKRHVLAELKRLHECTERIESRVDKLRNSQQAFEIKHGAFATLSGAIGAAIFYLTRGKFGG